MAINFSPGDYVIINRAYVDRILPTLATVSKQSRGTLGNIGSNPAQVSAVGIAPNSASFIRVVPVDTSSPLYKGGQGTVVYFPDDSTLNNSFERTTAYLDDKCSVKVFNNSGSTIAKGQLVYQTGFDTTQQLPTVDLASGSASATASVLGLVAADVANEACGSVIFSGSFSGLDTSLFSAVGDRVFLGNSAGTIAATAGTVEALVGRVLAIDVTDGAISLVQSLGGSGGGGGAQGATGLSGTTGIQGNTGIAGSGGTGLQGVTGLAGGDGSDGNTGIQGLTGLAGTDGISGDTGLQGIQGATGIGGTDGGDGATGVQGDTGLGVQGVTGLSGADGTDGVTGIQGDTGLSGGGATGVQGVTGIGSDGVDGATGIQGLAGSTGIQGLTGLAAGSTGLQGATGIGGGGGSASAINTIRFTVGTDATTDSSTSIPSGARVMFVSFDVTTAYTSGTDASIGTTGDASAFVEASNITTTSIATNITFTDVDGDNSVVRVTLTNGGAIVTGAATCIVWYATPDN